MIDSVLLVIGLAAILIGAMSGVLGTVIVLRKRSLLGDAIAHATLPGVAIAYLVFGKNPLMLVIGASIAGIIGVALVVLITNTTRLRADVVMGMMLAVFFGVGMVLLTYIQKMPTTGQAGLSSFVFGQAAAVVWDDIVLLSVIGGPIILLIAMAWPIIHAYCFDQAWLHARGLPGFAVDIIIMFLVSIIIALGLPMVGALLMSALLIAPAVAARQWVRSMSGMMVLAAIIGAGCGVAGAFLSASFERIPTGPTIVLLCVIVALFSLVLAPKLRTPANREVI
ncbi:MAG: metal ABC transporter permease [Roseiflexaceae bacterium]